MPEHLRALVVILFLSVTVFKLAERPITAVAISLRDYRRRRNLWFAIMLIAFFAHNFWVCIFAFEIASDVFSPAFTKRSVSLRP